MKIKLRLNYNKKEEVKDELYKMGVEINEDAELILTQEDYEGDTLRVKDDTDTVVINNSDILYIESVGKDIYVHTMKKTYETSQRIYMLEKILPREQFIRISNSVIIAKNSIKRIRPGLSQKFYLILKNDAYVDVTRTYYYKFKEYYRF